MNSFEQFLWDVGVTLAIVAITLIIYNSFRLIKAHKRGDYRR